MTHRADPVEVIGDGSWARCSCGKAVVLSDWRGIGLRWRHARRQEKGDVPLQLRRLA